jgi:NAD(P)-dependent dehydrogenase (short-subunit alcohol dehydrogenase family)
MQRRGLPEEIGEAVLFLSSNMASYITGQTLAVDGGLTAANVMSLPRTMTAKP